MPEKPLLHWQTAEYWSDPPSHFDLIPRWALHNSEIPPRSRALTGSAASATEVWAGHSACDSGTWAECWWWVYLHGFGPVMFASWQAYILFQENCWTRYHLNVSIFVTETVWKRPPGSSLKRKRRSEMWRAINLCRLGTAHSASIYVWWAVQQKLSLPTIPRTLSLEDAWWLYLRQTVNASA